MKPVFIYCLKDPETGEVRYIGQTNSLKGRLLSHLRVSSKFKSHLGNWLRGLNGKKPVMAVLHEVAEGESWQEEERRYISCARAVGVDLVNGTDGGEGTLGWRGSRSPETRAKISAARKGTRSSPETRAAISAARTGVPLSPERCAAISARMKGVPKSPETRAKMSAAKKGTPLSPEHCAALSAAHNKGPLSPEHCAALSAASKGVPKSPEARAKMSAARKGVPWSEARRAAERLKRLGK